MAKELGKGGGNVAYALKAAKTGNYKVAVVGTGDMDPIVYAAKDCTKLVSTCGSYADKTGEKGTETLELCTVGPRHRRSRNRQFLRPHLPTPPRVATLFQRCAKAPMRTE